MPPVLNSSEQWDARGSEIFVPFEIFLFVLLLFVSIHTCTIILVTLWKLKNYRLKSTFGLTGWTYTLTECGGCYFCITFDFLQFSAVSLTFDTVKGWVLDMWPCCKWSFGGVGHIAASGDFMGKQCLEKFNSHPHVMWSQSELGTHCFFFQNNNNNNNKRHSWI